MARRLNIIKSLGAIAFLRFIGFLIWHVGLYAYNHRKPQGLIFLLLIRLIPEASSQKYFQQEVNYKIDVSLNDKRHELSAFETIEYINNSPDTLCFLFFHLWPNAYSDNNTALAKQLLSFNGKQTLFEDPELKGYIDSLNFKANDQRLEWDLLPNEPDICKIILSKPLATGDTIIITTPFHLKIPKGVTSRLGHIEESYQISQWYPKPAVYDKSGWHQMPYLDQGEFYSDFGDFDISITLPENYIVGATGNLQNAQEAKMLDSLALDTVWKSKLGNYNGEDPFPLSSEQLKTLRYTGAQIHDFAWFADKRFHVMKGKVKLPESDREVTTWVMFTNRQLNLWKDAIHYVNDAIWSFSKWNGDYPYQSFTAVQSALSAGDGMEYPGITVIGLAGDAYSLDEVITHEVGHSWFYSALGSNERQYPFMDESITSANVVRYTTEKYPEMKLWEVYFKHLKLAKFLKIDKTPVQRMNELEWLGRSRTNLEQPISLSAPEFSESNYSHIIYNKAALCFNYLRAYLGDSLYDAIMHDYYHKWQFKHPQPNDLRSVFEVHTCKDLAWFFDDLLGTTKRLDYKILQFDKQQLLLKNNGELVSPLVIAGMTGDSIYFEKWVDGFEGEKWIDIPKGNYVEIIIDPQHIMPELYRLNNNIRTTGIFRKGDPVLTQLLFTMDDPDKRSLMYIPSIIWSKENGIMVGMLLQNGFFIPKRVEYNFAPFLSIKNPTLNGFGKISYNITPYNNLIRMATISMDGLQFGAPGNQNFHRVKTGLNLYFKPSNFNSAIRHKLYGYYIAASDINQIEFLKKAKIRSYIQCGYLLENTGINPFNLLGSFEYNKLFKKTSLEINYKFAYVGKNNGLDIRLFAATMLKNTSNLPFYALSASGRSGREDYLFQGFYPDRFTKFPKSFWSRQMTLSEGGIVSPINDSLGYSPWLISSSFTSSLPGRASRIPVKPFVNVLFNEHGLSMNHNSPFFCEAGLMAGIWGLFEVYVPLLVSRNIESINGSFKNRVRIVLKVDGIRQVKLSSKLF